MRGIFTRIAAVLTIVILLVGCTSNVIQQVRLDPKRPASIESQKYVDIKTTDGRTIRVYEPKLHEDRLSGLDTTSKPVEVEYVSIQSATVMTQKTDLKNSLFLVGGIVLIISLIAPMFGPNAPNRELSGSGSCPFVYTFDGTHYVLEGEPYGGAISRGLARTEWIPLDHLAEVENEYRLLLTNELSETEYTDELSLLMVDHEPGLRIIPDISGELHTIQKPLPPISATDGHGRDLMPELACRDARFWESGIVNAAASPERETRADSTAGAEMHPTADAGWATAAPRTNKVGGTRGPALLGNPHQDNPSRVAPEGDKTNELNDRRPDDGAPAALSSSAEDLRDEIVLTFPKPTGAREAKLVADAWTTFEGSAMAKEFLETRGTEAGAFLREVDAHGPAFFRLMSWFAREEFYLLNVDVETSSGWTPRAVINGGGPFIQKEKCYPLDVSDIPGDTLRVRVRPPAGFWRLNSFAVDYTVDEPVKVREIEAASATTMDGSDVAAALSHTDGTYHVMPNTGDQVDLRFVAPPPPEPGRARSFVLKASGWYDPRFDMTGEPQPELAERLLSEPGFALRWAVERWRAR